MLTGMPAHAVHHHHRGLHVGARVHDIAWQRATGEIGSLRVTRLFYRQLPTRFSRQGVPKGVLLIVSYKKPNTNVASYVRSIPRGERVQLAFHHEPEADYARGSTFVSQFNAQRRLAKRASSRIPFAFIGGGFAYRAKQPGYGGSFIPRHADRYYLDSYQRGVSWSPLRPAAKDPTVQRYIRLVARTGHRFNGFTEYGRGAVDRQHP